MQLIQHNKNDESRNLSFVLRKKLISYKRQSVSYMATSLLLLSSYFVNAQTLPTPVITGNTSFCAGTNTTLSTASVAGYTYCWQNTSASTTWQNVGTAGFTGGRSFFQSLVFNDNTPYVAYQDEDYGGKASVMKFDGTNWVHVGIRGFSSGYSAFENLAFIGNTPYVAFRDWGSNSSGKCTVMKFDGINWVNVGNPGFSGGEAGYLKFVINNGILYVAFQDGATNYGATVMKFDGTNWVYVGNPGFSASGVNYMSLAFSGNTPYVAYADARTTVHKTTVMKFDGTNWVNVGDAQFTPGASRNQSLAIDGTTPYVAFVEDALNFKTSVMKFDGVNWAYVGGQGITSGASGHPCLVIKNNTPYIAYQDDANGTGSTVKKFDGTNWVLVGNASFSSGFANYQSLAFNGKTPYVAFADYNYNYKTTVMKYEPCAGTSNTLLVNTPGTFTVTVTNSSGSTATSAPVTVTANSIPIVSCPPNREVCSSAPSFALTGGSPAGGIYSGPGVSNSQFNPSSAGAGIKNITYTYTDPSTGCSNSCSFTITVTTPPALVIAPVSNNITLNLDANGNRTLSLADIATVTGGCNGNPFVRFSPTSFNCSSIGSQTVTVEATDGSFGSASNPSAAGFNYPFALDFDAVGNLYILENNRLRKIAVDGTTSTIAGGSDGFADGQGSAARFNQAKGIAIDVHGNIFIGDWGNNAIRKVTPSGLVTTFAGNGVAGYADGIGTNALFNGPAGLCFDETGNLWVADAENHRIRKISPSGVVTTIAGTGTGSSINGSLATASFNYPMDIDFDLNGNAYIVDLRSNKLRLLTSSGVTTVAGSGSYGFADGAASTAMFANLSCVEVGNDGNIYLADRSNKRIRKLTAAGQVQTLATSAGEITGLAKNSSGSYYFIDYQNHYVKRLTATGNVTIVAGTGFQSSANGNVGQQPSGNESSLQIAVNIVDNRGPVITPVANTIILPLNANGTRTITHSDIAVVTDNCNSNPLVTITPSSFNCSNVGQQSVTVTATDGTFGTPRTPGNATFFNPFDLEFDQNGTLIIADYQNNKVRKLTPSGIVSTLAGNGVRASVNGTGTNASFDHPTRIAVDASGNTYVIDYFNHGIKKVTPAGVVTTYAGGTSGLVNGSISTARFTYPSLIALDPMGNLFVVDHGNNLIRKITPSGIVSTFIGDGSCGTEGYCTITALATDASGNVYIGKDNKIRKITPAGVATWIAGTGTYGSADGPAMSATLANPWNIVVDASGTIWFTDQTINKIRRITTTGTVETLPITANNVNPTNVKGIAISPTGSLFITAGDAIVERTQNGTQTLIAGAFNNYGASDGNVGGGQSGNQTTMQITVTITGNSTPVFTTTQSNVSVIAGSSCNVVLGNYTGGVAATSSCGGVVTISQSPDAGTVLSMGSTLVTLTATDASNNSAIQTFSVNVTDNEPPVITPLSSNTIIQLGANGSRTITRADVVNVSDCNPNTDVKITPSTFTCADIGNQTITVEATDGSFGTGPNPAAVSFTNPQTAVVDAAGNVYVAANNQIRKISVTGEVTTLAGSGVASSIDGTGLAASFNELHGLSIDAAGNLYTAEIWSRKVRKVSPAGVVTTVAGSGAMGSNDGPAASASFIWVFGVAVDPQGNIYVVDAGSYKIRKISTTGIVSTYAGTGALGSIDGPANTATFNYPSSIAIDNAGNIYVGEQFKIRKITPGGIVSTFAGSNVAGNVPGIGTNARIARPMGMVFDAAGNLFATQEGEGRIIKITPAAEVSTFAGHYGETTINGVGTAATFRSPEGLGIDASGNLYVADWFLKNIRKITPAAVVTTFAGSGIAGSQNGNISGITGNYSSIQVPVVIKDVTAPVITPVSNNIIINLDATGNKTITVADIATATDNCNPSPLIRINPTTFNCSNIGIQTVTVEATDGSFPTTPNPSNASFFDPYGIETDVAGNLYISDWGNQKIRKISTDGTVSTLAGNGTAGLTNGTGANASFRDPRGVATDAQGNVYVGDVNNHCVRKITPSGVVSIFAGNGTAGYLDGVGTNARLSSPRGLAVDAQGNVYVCDNHNARIRKITPTGVVSTIAGNGVFASVDGVGTNASIYDAVDIDIDNNGNLYFVDQSGNKIRKISPSGVVTTIAGDGTYGYNDGPANTARFANPVGLTVDDAGNIYVADHNNYMIRKITPDGVVSSLANITAPTGIAFGVDGNLYTSDYTNRIKKISLSGIATLFAGDGSNGSQNGNIGGAGSGNYSTLQVQIAIRDITAPVITCPANITTPTNNIHPNQTGWATATDNCTPSSAIVITYTDNTGQGCNMQRTWKATDASGNFSTCVQSIAIPQMSVSLGQDMYVLYGALGYVGCKTITPVITGGVAPYTYVWTSTQASVHNSTAASISVCNTTEVTQTYTVTVTAANGCVATSTLQLTFINISCSNNNNSVKVKVCLRPQGNPNNCNTVCVSESAAQVLINNGSYYGNCLPDCEIPIQGKSPILMTETSTKAPASFEVIVANNPTHNYFEVRVNTPGREKISMRLFDVSGRTLEIKQNVMPGEINNIGGSYISGTYFAEIVQGENRKIVKLVKQ